MYGVSRRLDLSPPVEPRRVSVASTHRRVPALTNHARRKLRDAAPSLYGSRRATPSLQRHRRGVCVGCIQHGWLASTSASTMGVQRALPHQARTERRASWVRSMHRVVARRPVRVRPSGSTCEKG